MQLMAFRGRWWSDLIGSVMICVMALVAAVSVALVVCVFLLVMSTLLRDLSMVSLLIWALSVVTLMVLTLF